MVIFYKVQTLFWSNLIFDLYISLPAPFKVSKQSYQAILMCQPIMKLWAEQTKSKDTDIRTKTTSTNDGSNSPQAE